jgi:nicotinamide-nucleotide amidase
MKKDVLAEIVIKSLKKSGRTLSVAESITGGGLGAALTSIPGASDVFLGGVIAYTDKSKLKILEVANSILRKESAVSEAAAKAMAESVRIKFKSDYAISTTGVAGPGKAYGQKAGTVWIGIASKKEVIAVALFLTGDREAVRNATIESAFATFSRIIAP